MHFSLLQTPTTVFSSRKTNSSQCGEKEGTLAAIPPLHNYIVYFVLETVLRY